MIVNEIYDINSSNKINIGCGKVNWSNWILLDEINYPGVRLISFNKNTKLPYKDNSISLFYSSHFFEHINDESINRLLNEIKRVSVPGSFFILKIPDFSWFLDQYNFKIKQSMDETGLDSLVITWSNYNLEDCFENRVAAHFCSYFTIPYGDHFGGNFNIKSKNSYFGPPKVPVNFLKKIFKSNSPNEISKILSLEALKDPLFKSFNHQNSWSESEMAKVLSEFNLNIESINKELICYQFKEIIPDIFCMYDWSKYYLIKVIK